MAKESKSGAKKMKLNKEVMSPSVGGKTWSPSGNSGLKVGKQAKSTK